MKSQNKWHKKYKNTIFKEPIPCPYGSCEAMFSSSLILCRHVLQPYPKGHNWNQNYKEPEEAKETTSQ